MPISPTRLDLWIAYGLAGLLNHHAQFDLFVESAILRNVLGGVWFGAALFVCWIYSQRKDQTEIQRHTLTILAGSVLAVLFVLVAGAIFSWPPPSRYPGLDNVFPGYLEPNPNTNCFPSQSTALYSSIAAGIYSLHKGFGRILWVFVAVFIALPRMYVGGHYLTDVLVGLVLGLAAYLIVRRFLEIKMISKIEPYFETRPRLEFLWQLAVFLWIFQVTVEFKDAHWLKAVVGTMIK